MYFLHGWPKSYQVPLNGENIISIRHSPDRALIAIVTPSTVYIWSGDQVCIHLFQLQWLLPPIESSIVQLKLLTSSPPLSAPHCAWTVHSYPYSDH